MTDRGFRPSKRQIDNAMRAGKLLNEQYGLGDPFAAAIRGIQKAILITDPRQDDNPIIFANDAFCALTGYDRTELIGRNCRLLQGPDTSARELDRLREAIADKTAIHTDIVNYRKDGTSFWNSLFISPVRNEDGEVIFFFGSQSDITNTKLTEKALNDVNDELRETKTLLGQQIDDRTAELMRLLSQRSRLVNELDHRVKNNLQIINSLLRFELRRDLGDEAQDLANRLHQRIDALGLAHKEQHNKEAVGYFRLDDFIRTLVARILNQHPDWWGEPDYEMDMISLPIGKAAPLSLALNEFVRMLLTLAAEQPGDAANVLKVKAAAKAGTLTLTIASDSLDRDACQASMTTVENWTLLLLEKQLEAQIEFLEDGTDCGVRIIMPMNETYHAELEPH